MSGKELWLPVVGWGAYEVSSLGKVRRATRASGTRVGYVLSPINRRGYHRVVLRQDGKTRQVDIQILVAEAFIGPRPSTRHHAAHLNGRPDDCRLENIQWKTIEENDADKDKHKTRPKGSSHSLAILNEDAVRHIKTVPRRNGVLSDLSKQYGVSPRTIANIRCGSKWKHVEATQ